MTLYAYEDRQAHRHGLTIHSSDCEECNAGKGNLDGRDCIFGQWHGPFTSLDHAFARMHHLRQITELHQCLTMTPVSSGSEGFDSKHEEADALLRLDDDGGANSAGVLPGQID
jgi:hypothetical protein